MPLNCCIMGVAVHVRTHRYARTHVRIPKKNRYQQWLSKVNAAVHVSTDVQAHAAATSNNGAWGQWNNNSWGPTTSSTARRHHATGEFSLATAAGSAPTSGGAATASARYGDLGLLSVPVVTPHRPTAGQAWTPFTRILVSATLTTNPQRLEEMQLLSLIHI